MSCRSTRLSQGNGALAADLHKIVSAKTRNENFVISPIAIQSCLTVIYTGSDGETAEQLLHGMRLEGSTKSMVEKSFRHILEKYSALESLQLANKIYIEKNVAFKSSFNKTIAKEFFSEIEHIDFSDAVAAASALNQSISQKTNSKIEKIVNETSFSSTTNLIIINACYFKGMWDKPFDEKLTEIKPFWVLENESREVEMMCQTGFFRYGFIEELSAFALEMKYCDSDVWILIILPNEGTTLAAMEEPLQFADLYDISLNLNTKNVEVWLPKFTVECQIELQSCFEELGIKSLFQDPDLSEMLENPIAKIDKIIHKAVVEVSEEGSPRGGLVVSSFPNESNEAIPPASFKADHPFFFAIKSDCAVLVTGHYVFPGTPAKNN